MYRCSELTESNSSNNNNPILESKNNYKRTFLYQELLPYKVQSEEKQLENLNEIIKNIYISLAANDFFKASIFSKELNNWLNLKFDLPSQIRTKLVNVYYELCTTQGIAPGPQKNFESLFLSLTKRHYYLSIHDISLDWRPAFLVLKRIMFPNDETSIKARPGLSLDNISIIPIIKNARMYFPSEEIPNIFNELLPLFNTSIISDAFIVAGMLNLFLPCHPSLKNDPKLDPEYWLPSIFHLWLLVSNSNYYDFIFLDLLGRLAKESLPVSTRSACLFTNNQLSHIFTTILRLFDIPVGNIKSLVPSNFDSQLEIVSILQQKSFTKEAAKLIIYSISPLCITRKKRTKVLLRLKILLQSIETYFHPLNHGPWSINLAKFLYNLSNYFVGRWNKESNKELEILQEKKLNLQIRKEFVLALRKVTFMTIYSRNSEVMEQSQMTLQKLAYLEPSLILPGILRRIYPSLTGLVETHRTISSLRSLCVLAPIISSTSVFRNYLTNLLGLVLPGIDANDLDKTIHSLIFISRVAQNVPFHDLAGDENGKIALNWIENELNKFDNMINDDDYLLENCNNNDYEINTYINNNIVAKSSTAFFREFILAFLDRLFILFENFSDEASLKTKSIENNVIEILPSTLTYFFASLSDDFFKLALEKIINFVSNNVIYQSIHAVSFLCNSCALRNPKLFFQKLFPILKANILFEIENNGAGSTRNASIDVHPRDKTLLWNLQILSTSINGSGEILIQYKEDLTEILDILIEKSRGNIITHVGIFFSLILSNFTTIYPINRQMFEFNTEDYENIQPDNWAIKTNSKNLNIQWHVPSEEEITFSVDLFTHQCDKILESLSYLVKTYNKSTFKTGKEWSDNIVKYLSYLKKALLGIASLFDSNSKIENEASENNENYKIKYRYPSGYFFENKKNDLSIHIFLTNYHNDDIQCFKSLISTLKTWLLDVLYCQTTDLLDSLIRSYTDDIQPYKINGLRKKYPRALLIKRAEIYHVTRIKFNAKHRNMTSLDTILLKDLVSSCLSFYSEIRQHAQNALNIAAKVITNSQNIIIPPLLNAMLSSDIEILKGATYSLCTLKHLKHIVISNWDFIPRFIYGLIHLTKFDRFSLKKVFDKAYIDFIVTFKLHSRVILYEKKFLNLIKPTDNINTEIMALSKDVDKKHIYIYNEIKNLRHELINIIKNTHWRTSAMIGTGLIGILVNVENPPDSILVSSVIQESINDHPLLRSLYIASLTSFLSILWQHGLTNGNLKAILLEEIQIPTKVFHYVNLNEQNVEVYTKEFLFKFSNPVEDYFVDSLQYGWLIWPKKYPVYVIRKELQLLQPDSFTEETFDSINHLFSEAWFEVFFNHLKQESRQGFPKFRIIIAVFIKFLFQMIKNIPCYITLNNLKQKIEQLCIPENDKHKIRAGSEILSGLVASLKYESVEYCNQTWEWILPIVKKNFENITPETLNFWLNFVKFCFSEKDPRRSWSFFKMLISFRLDKKSSLAFKESAKIALLRKAIKHCGWHFQFTNPIIENLLLHLDHPFNSVRNEIAKTLSIIASFEYHESFCNVKSFIEYQYQNRNSYLMIPYISSNHLKDIVKKIFSQLKSWKSKYILRSDSLSYISGCKTVLSWLKYSLNSPEHALIVPHIPKTILPEIIFMLDVKEDPELLSSVHQVLQQIGNICFPSYLLRPMTNSIIKIMTSSENWHHKLNVFPLLQSFFFRNLFTLHQNCHKKLLKEIKLLLQDPQIEVRLSAASTLTGIIQCARNTSKTDILQLLKQFSDLLTDNPLQKNCATLTVISRHAAVLGLSALVMAFPYDTPEPWIPPVVSRLARIGLDPHPIGSTVRKFVADFKKTHSDTWDMDQKTFTKDELDDLSELSSHNYFT
ncbi:unnamed protein product [Pneumocystis jirovecii]|uniref:Proteasome activator complex subunit 4 C-terminal domain-containing protein n=1 Tax=Pneumocystis jirovecii TaxID=42068 RepID=L0P9B4_PNEJI|nr:unnamed protein product [Pneumocystis jirovecii]